MHGVIGSTESARSGRDVIGDDPVGLLADLLGDGVLDNPLGLRGEADDQAWPVFV